LGFAPLVQTRRHCKRAAFLGMTFGVTVSNTSNLLYSGSGHWTILLAREYSQGVDFPSGVCLQRIATKSGSRTVHLSRQSCGHWPPTAHLVGASSQPRLPCKPNPLATKDDETHSCSPCPANDENSVTSCHATGTSEASLANLSRNHARRQQGPPCRHAPTRLSLPHQPQSRR
jgi:hypothetical protein